MTHPIKLPEKPRDFVFPKDLPTIGGNDRWLIRPLFPQGALIEFKGQQKTAGKSTMLFEMIACISQGKPFLGFVPEALGPVVYLSEQPPQSLYKSLTRASLQDSEAVHLWLLMLHFQKKWATAIGSAVKRAVDIGAKLLVVDTLSQFALASDGLDENDAGTAYKILLPLQRALREGITVVLVRHERKGGGGVANAGRGSTAVAGAVDVLVSVSKPTYRPGLKMPNTVREIRTLSRFEEIPETLLVNLTDEGYVKWTAADSEDFDIDVLLPATIDDVVKKTGMSRATVQRRLKGYETRGTGHKSDPLIFLPSGGN